MTDLISWRLTAALYAAGALATLAWGLHVYRRDADLRKVFHDQSDWIGLAGVWFLFTAFWPPFLMDLVDVRIIRRWRR